MRPRLLCRDFIGARTGDAFVRGYCLGLVMGALRYAPGVCHPQGVTGEQFVRVAVQYIDSQPGRMHEDFVALAIEAVRKTWPCGR
jgi:Rap1a immunity proteins